MTPDQLERRKAVDAAMQELEGMLKRVPPSVINGDAMRARAWKDAVVKARRVMAQKVSDPSKLREQITNLKVASGATPEELARHVYG